MADSLDFELFVSYSCLDDRLGQITEIVARIQKEYRNFTGRGELRVFFDKRELGSSDDWQQRALNAISSSRLLLVCLSPNYLQSEYCAWEINQYLRHKASGAPATQNIGSVYFVEIPAPNDSGFEQRAAEWVAGLQLKENFEFRPWFDEGAADLEQAAVRDLLKNSEAQTEEGINRIRRVVDTKGNLDQRNEHFVGRGTELRRLREMLVFGKAAVVTMINGQEGIGKTALAVEYGHLFAHEYPGGCWQVSCGGRDDLRVALATLAGVRDLDFSFTEQEKRNLDLGLDRVLSELKQRANSAEPNCVLLLLDDVDQAKLLEPDQVRRLPRAEWLRIIVTTKALVQNHCQLSVELLLGAEERLPVRLVALRLPPALAAQRRRRARANAKKDRSLKLTKRYLKLLGWTILLTNVSAAQLSAQQLWEVYSTRWQIEVNASVSRVR